MAIAARHQTHALRVNRREVAQSLLLSELGLLDYPSPVGHDTPFVQADIVGNRQALLEQSPFVTGALDQPGEAVKAGPDGRTTGDGQILSELPIDQDLAPAVVRQVGRCALDDVPARSAAELLVRPRRPSLVCHHLYS